MRAGLVALVVVAVIVVGGLMWGVGVNNELVRSEQAVNEKWAQVQNVYQRRADLIPNLVETVKGFATQERTVLEEVTKARASVAGIKATPELINDPVAFQKFQKAQSELGGALSRLLVTVENYPNLKSDQNFLALQSQLEGTENRITVARNRYIDAVRIFNTTVRSFPVNLTAMLFGYSQKPSFTVEDEKAIARPPTVNFGNPAPAPAAPPPAAAPPAADPPAATTPN